jgi:hypothetical protein
MDVLMYWEQCYRMKGSGVRCNVVGMEAGQGNIKVRACMHVELFR